MSLCCPRKPSKEESQNMQMSTFLFSSFLRFNPHSPP